MRFKPLDGLRGFAAFVVVISHWVSIYNKSPGSPFESNPVLNLTSLVFGNLASHAVWLFFVLSGFVLSRSFTTKKVPYWRYLASRGIRLYLPTIAAVIATYLLIYLVPRNGIQKFNWWMAYHPASPDALDFFKDVVLIFGESGTMLVLWSLTFEVWFSILLKPILELMKKTNPLLMIAILALISGIGQWFSISFVEYLPMFVIGVSLQMYLAKDSRKGIKPIGMPFSKELACLAIALVLLLFSYMTLFKAGFVDVSYSVDVCLSLISISMMIYAALNGSMFRKLLESRIAIYLGSISFSLYLVHETVLVNAVILSGNNFAVVSCAVVLAFVIADIFYRHIEQKSHKLARQVLEYEAK